MDDCSDDELTKQYLYTNNNISLNQINWEEQIYSNKQKKENDLDIFKKYFNDLPDINNEVIGIKNKFTIISPECNLGDKNGILWTIYKGFTYFPNSDYIIVLDDDILFNKDWLVIANQIYYNTVNTNQKPGIISVYNRESNEIINNSLYFQVKSIGGVMMLIPRYIFNLFLNVKMFDQRFKGNNNFGSDVYLYNFILNNGFYLYNSSSSYIQHIGIKSICNEGKYLRYSKNFLKPYAWNKDFDK